ncbi:hypothetical protein [Hymenobacter sp. B1770]|uniref:hypothetical protein n=1 Tax=Hymenobacter sp. B1770 TaxID=1718788 RepID=UPI003CF264C2
MFSSTKAGHISHIVTTALLGQVVSSGLTPPDPSKIEHYGQLIIQALVALVTIWATVRKALQKPVEVVPQEKTGNSSAGSNGNGAE